MGIDITTCVVLSYVVLLEIALVTDLVVAIKRWRAKKRGNFDQEEKYKKILKILRLSPIIISLIPSIYLSAGQGGNILLWLIAGSIKPSIPFLAMGITAMVPSSAKANSNDQSTDVAPSEKKKRKIRSGIIIAAAIIGLVLGIAIGVLWQLDIL